jgi:hypothetical protein
VPSLLIDDFHPVAKDATRVRPATKEESETLREALIWALLKIRNKKRYEGYFKVNRAQREYARSCTKRNIVLKARQLGMTTYIAARFFIHSITQPGTLTLQVAHTQESAEAIFRMVHRFWENLPGGLRRGALVRSKASVRQMVFPRLDSEYRVATAADLNAGRGMTIHNLHCSEVARWPRDGAETLASLRAAVVGNGEIVLESTPNGAGGVFYEEWQHAEELGYTRHFFPWWYDEEYRVEGPALEDLNEEEKELMRRHGLSQGQIGWRRKVGKELRALAPQEYAEDASRCFLASGDCVFDIESIEKALSVAMNPEETSENGRMVVWLPPMERLQYVIGVDPAGGGSQGDYACAQVIERMSGLQCAELHGHLPPLELAAKVMELSRAYNGALLAVERNNHGFGVLAHLQEMGCGNVYRENGQEGWLTSAVSRPAMIENLSAVLVTEPGLLQSRRLLNECRTFVRQTDGNTGAMAGAHDDCVMAMAIALAVRKKDAGRARAVEVGSVDMGRSGQ